MVKAIRWLAGFPTPLARSSWWGGALNCSSAASCPCLMYSSRQKPCKASFPTSTHPASTFMWTLFVVMNLWQKTSRLTWRIIWVYLQWYSVGLEFILTRSIFCCGCDSNAGHILPILKRKWHFPLLTAYIYFINFQYFSGKGPWFPLILHFSQWHRSVPLTATSCSVFPSWVDELAQH